MIINVVEIFTEYLSVILCEHKIAKKKIALDRYFWMFFLLDLFSILLAHEYREEHGWLMMLVYVNFFVYVKMRLCKKWADAVKVFGGMLILIPSMQLVIYYFVKFILYIFDIMQSNGVIGIEVNCIICMLMMWGRKEYVFYIAKRIVKSNGILVFFFFAVFFIYLLLNYKLSDSLNEQLSFQSFIGVGGIGTIVILWINAENEKRNKVKEIQLYEIYNKTFEEAIAAIRIRQHEFDNHINAIKCLQYTIDNPKELVEAQNEYCDNILMENSFNKLLKLHMEPILSGFLYSKFMNAKEQGILVFHEVHEIRIENKIDVSILIEIMGILIDNAIEALVMERNDHSTLIIKLLQEDTRKISIEVANSSKKYLNSEIEKFCAYAYSTKGENRGFGLPRVKEIVKKNRGNIIIENIQYNKINYLSFKIILNT